MDCLAAAGAFQRRGIEYPVHPGLASKTAKECFAVGLAVGGRFFPSEKKRKFACLGKFTVEDLEPLDRRVVRREQIENVGIESAS